MDEPMHVHTKVCGITRVAEAAVAVEAGASAIGLVFCRESPRCVSVDMAAVIVAGLPAHVAAVGVFVNPTRADVTSTIEKTGIDAVQLHGDETPEFVAGLQLVARRIPRPVGFLPPTPAQEAQRVAVIKAFRVRDSGWLETAQRYRGDLWLLDSYVPGHRGGTGAQFNWRLAAMASRPDRPVVLAGGLRPDNVADAVRTVRPHAVDVSSGVEVEPGRKDPNLVRAFIQAVADAATR